MTATFDPAPTGAITDLTGSYTIDASHSRIGFQARHAMVTTVRGSFQQVEGSATLNQADPSASTVAVTMQVASITTSGEQRDEHLRSADFFDAETYPTMTFRSSSVEKTDDSSYQVTGDLTIKDVTRSVVLDLEVTGAAKDPFGMTRVGVEGGTVINRKDWGLVWNAALETGGVLVSEKIRIELDIALVRSE